MLASFRDVLPSSVLSSISNNPAPKNLNQPKQSANDTADEDNLPTSPSDRRAMAVDEQGVKKKKGKSSEVSLLSFVCGSKCHRCGCAFLHPLWLRARPLSVCHNLHKPSP